jgi:phospholipase A1
MKHLNLLLLPGLVLSATVHAGDQNTNTFKLDKACTEEALHEWPQEVRLATVREICNKDGLFQRQSGESAVEKRLKSERINSFEPYVMLPYRPNYLLLAAHYFNDMHQKPYEDASILQKGPLDNTEAKFQVSLKIPVSENVLGGRWFVAYTNRSFWQAYNGKNSKPFRETNHEPETWLSFDQSIEMFGWRYRLFDVGLSHQSNGQAEPLSRSWNRLYARFIFEKGHSFITFKPWYRFPESQDKDDNPNIQDYMGNFEILVASKIGRNNLSMMLRNNLDGEQNRGAIELNYSYPIQKHLNGYIQWFNGYGESMIDYNYHHNTIGIGVQLGSWL